MKTLFILNDLPYGTERCYNALRVASALLKKDAEADVIVFLMADAVIGARAGQKTPEGYYNIERMLKRVLNGHGQVLLCGTCMDARAVSPRPSSCRVQSAARWTHSPPRYRRPTRYWCFDERQASRRQRRRLRASMRSGMAL